jgi:hypothetical protein
MTEFLNVEIRAGQPVQVGKRTITPFAQSFQLTFPGWIGGLIWNRPVSVLVQDEDGQEEVIPIPDVTRQTIWAFAGLSLVFTLVLWLLVKLFRR